MDLVRDWKAMAFGRSGDESECYKAVSRGRGEGLLTRPWVAAAGALLRRGCLAACVANLSAKFAFA